MIKKLAYWIIYKELTREDSPFTGKYDAKNGSEHFMYGVAMVMEQIAYGVSTKVGDRFQDLFTDNMLASEGRAIRSCDEKCKQTEVGCEQTDCAWGKTK